MAGLTNRDADGRIVVGECGSHQRGADSRLDAQWQPTPHQRDVAGHEKGATAFSQSASGTRQETFDTSQTIAAIHTSGYPHNGAEMVLAKAITERRFRSGDIDRLVGQQGAMATERAEAKA